MPLIEGAGLSRSNSGRTLSAYDRVVTEIYEAALDPSRWDYALTTMIAEFAPCDWEVAFLAWERIEKPAGRMIGQVGLVPLVQTMYLNLFAGRNEWSRRAFSLPVGSVVHTNQLITQDEFRNTAFFKLFMKHFNHSVAIIGVLDKHNEDKMALVCPGPPELDVGPLQQAITMLLPHFQRAAKLSRRIGEADMRAANAANLLDSSPYPVFALGEDLRLLHANTAAEEALNSGLGLRRSGDRLYVIDPKVRAELLAMSFGQGSEKSRMFAIHDDRGSAIAISALAVDQAQSVGFANPAAGATLMLIGGQRLGVTEGVVDQLRASFGFTLAEARLAGHIIEGSGLEGYAEARGVSINAARYLMRGIYEKTGLDNQFALSAHLREVPLGWDRPANRKLRRIVSNKR